MIRRALAALATTAVVAVGTILSGSPAQAAPIAATLTNECGIVRITYTAAGTTEPFQVKRNGTTVFNGTTHNDTASWNFAIFAQSGEIITLAGGLSGGHTHVTPPGCAEPKVSVVSIRDYCGNDGLKGPSAVTIRNSGTAAATGFRFVTSAGVTPIDSVPVGDSLHFITANEYETYVFGWGNPDGALAAVLNHTYAIPGNCSSAYLSVTYADKCDGLHWTVKNTGGGVQGVDLFKGASKVDSKWVEIGTSPDYVTAAAEGDVFSLRYNGTSTVIGDRHTYHQPAGCDLPKTGTNTKLVTGIGVALVLLGGGAYFLARRRRTN